jgi:hypothetical protein
MSATTWPDSLQLLSREFDLWVDGVDGLVSGGVKPKIRDAQLYRFRANGGGMVRVSVGSRLGPDGSYVLSVSSDNLPITEMDDFRQALVHGVYDRITKESECNWSGSVLMRGGIPMIDLRTPKGEALTSSWESDWNAEDQHTSRFRFDVILRTNHCNECKKQRKWWSR